MIWSFLGFIFFPESNDFRSSYFNNARNLSPDTCHLGSWLTLEHQSNSLLRVLICWVEKSSQWATNSSDNIPQTFNRFFFYYYSKSDLKNIPIDEQKNIKQMYIQDVHCFSSDVNKILHIIMTDSNCDNHLSIGIDCVPILSSLLVVKSFQIFVFKSSTLTPKAAMAKKKNANFQQNGPLSKQVARTVSKRWADTGIWTRDLVNPNHES